MKKPSPEQRRRYDLVEDFSKLLRRSFAYLDLSMEAVASSVGRGRTAIRRWCDKDRMELPNAADLAMMDTDAATAILREIAEHHGLTVSKQVQHESKTVIAAVTSMHERVAAASTACLTAIADGEIDAEEDEKITIAVDDLIEELQGIKAGCTSRKRRRSA